MTKTPTRYLSFNLRALEPDGVGTQWNWSVYEGRSKRFLRDGQITGDREKAEHAARAAISLMGGVVRETEEDDA